MSMKSSDRCAMTAAVSMSVHPLRRAALFGALSLALAGVSVPALARECAQARDGSSIVFARNPFEAPGSISRYEAGGGQPNTYYRPGADLHRIEINACLFDYIQHQAVTTDQPIEVVVNNTDTSLPDAPTSVRINDIALAGRTVTRNSANPDARNIVSLNSGLVYQVFGPGGDVPTTININGGVLDGAFGLSSASPSRTVRNGDILNIRGGRVADIFHLGGGNDTFNISGGDAKDLELHGDGPAFDAAILGSAANTFDDIFNISGGAIGVIHADSGDRRTITDGTSLPTGNDRFNISGGAAGELHGNAGNDTFLITGTATIGAIYGGLGADLVDFAPGTSLARVGSVNGTAYTGSSDPAVHDPAIDTLRFHGHRVAIGDRAIDAGDCRGSTPPASCIDHVRVRNFERIELLDGTRAQLENDPVYGGQLGAHGMSAGSLLLIDATSSLSLRSGGAQNSYAADLNYNVQNNGVLDLGQDATGDVAAIEGDWSGSGRVLMATYLGADDSATDRIDIVGNVTGRTTLDVKPVAGSPGARTVEGIALVRTSATSVVDSNGFVLAAPLTTENGLWQYRLAFRQGAAQSGSFVLTSAAPAPPPPPPPPSVTPPPSLTPPPITTPPPTLLPPPTNGDRLLAPAVPVLAIATGAAQDTALDAIGTARDRRAQRRMTTYGDGDTQGASPAWARARFDRTDTRGDRIGLEQQQFLFQGGLDLRADDDIQRGLMASYAAASGDVHDYLRPTLDGFSARLGSKVGDVRTQALGVGGYQTLTWRTGWYVDLAGQATALRIRLESMEGMRETSDGWNFAASAETGRTIAMRGGAWTVEPQAQLIASQTRLEDFDDGLVSSGDLRKNAVRGRLGLRMATAAPGSTGAGQVYAVANLWRDLHDDQGIRISGGTDTLIVDPGLAHTWAEVGLGAQHNAGRGRLYFDVRGQQGIGRGDRDAFVAQAGYTLDW